MFEYFELRLHTGQPYRAMGWTAEEEGFDSRQEQGTSLSSKQFTSALRPIRSIFLGVSAAEA